MKGNVEATLVATSGSRSQNLSGLTQRVRGLALFIIHRVVKVIFISIFPAVGNEILNSFLLNVIAELHLSTLKMLNIHAIISQPLKGSYFKRVFDFSMWLKLFPASLLHSLGLSICFYLPVHVNRLYGITDGKANPYGEKEFAKVFALMVALYFGISVPCYAIFIRVAASLLAREDGSQAKVDADLSIWRAWKTLSWSDYIAFVRLLAVVLALEIGISVAIFWSVMTLFHPALHNDVAAFFVKYAG